MLNCFSFNRKNAIGQSHIQPDLDKEYEDKIWEHIKSALGKEQKPRRIVRVGLKAASAALLIGAAGSLYFSLFHSCANSQFYSAAEIRNLANAENVPGFYIENEAHKRVFLQTTARSRTFNFQGQSIRMNSDTIFFNGEKPSNELLSIHAPQQKVIYVSMNDSTRIVLNSNAKIAFNSDYQKNKRCVALNGEALFEVTHKEQNPFVVYTSNDSVKDIGTKFIISNQAADSVFRAIIMEGEIEIRSNQYTAGDLVKVNNKKQEVSHSKVKDYSNYRFWASTCFHFDKENIDSVVESIAQWYGKKVKWNIHLNQTFSGDIPKNISYTAVEEILNEISDYSVKDSTNYLIVNPKIKI
ncbi:MAG TPA: FecR family protein [Arachidicoccus sp.]